MKERKPGTDSRKLFTSKEGEPEKSLPSFSPGFN